MNNRLFFALHVLILKAIQSNHNVHVSAQNQNVATDGASLQRYLALHDMESLHQALSIRFHESERMMDVEKRITPLPPNKIQRGSGLDFTTKYKLQADLEQILYLIDVQEEAKENDVISFNEEKLNLFRKVKDVYQKVLDKIPSDDELELTNGGYYKFQPHDIEAGILEYYNRALYRPETDDESFYDDTRTSMQQTDSCTSPDENENASQGHCHASNNDNNINVNHILNPELDWKLIEKEYYDQDPQVVVIDNILTEQALQKIRKILLEGTVFYQTKRPIQLGGYTGAYIDDGLHDRILLELTTELRNHLPSVLDKHALRYLWAYKYDSTYNGIKLHADMAAVNVNLWITPNEANLDPDSGGLVVFTVKPPSDWDILQYNSDTDKVYEELLKPAGMKNVTIPYRENRAVLFDSALFHQTDHFHFKKGYPNRRINLTILYGDMQRPST